MTNESTPAMIAKACWRAAELVEQGHCKGAFAKTASGVATTPCNQNAVAWCAEGAYFRAEREVSGVSAFAWERGRDALRAVIRGRWPTDWNGAPERTADEVAAAFRLAAERIEAMRAT